MTFIVLLLFLKCLTYFLKIVACKQLIKCIIGKKVFPQRMLDETIMSKDVATIK